MLLERKKLPKTNVFDTLKHWADLAQMVERWPETITL